MKQSEKILYIIRHAKSSWSLATLNDFDRPLNERGQADAPMMAQKLLDKNIRIDHFVSSPAKRAIDTASFFAKKYNYPKESIEIISSLYHASATVFLNAIEMLDDKYNSVAVFSHNPGITEFVNMMVDSVIIDNMPTCGVFAVRVRAGEWKDFQKAEKDFLFFDYPKNI